MMDCSIKGQYINELTQSQNTHAAATIYFLARKSNILTIIQGGMIIKKCDNLLGKYFRHMQSSILYQVSTSFDIPSYLHSMK